MSGKKNGKASAPIRMAQPYAGTGHGMHFPLHKGTEVLLTFIDGDPDRPIIAAACRTRKRQARRRQSNQTKSSNHDVKREPDTFRGQGRDRAYSNAYPNQKSFIRIGAPNDPSLDDEPPEPTQTPTETEEDDDDRKAGFVPLDSGSSSGVYAGGGIDGGHSRRGSRREWRRRRSAATTD